MPEGDTIHRTAATLRAVLGGHEVTGAESTAPRVRAVGVGRLVGQAVDDVEARGKHLLVWFAPSDLALHTHLGMSGSWHTYRPTERWRKPAHLARFVLRTPAAAAVCFSAPTVELLARAQVDRHPSLERLGPDALDPDTDLAEARRRLDLDGDRPIGVALLDQRVLAGVGNVYRCEVLFRHAVNPWTAVADVPPATRDALLATAERLLKANVSTRRRVTVSAPGSGRDRHAVYGRARRPCPRCGAPIRVSRLGEHARLVYWCPACQE